MSIKMDYPSPHKKAAKMYNLPSYRQLGPGPTNVSTSVLNAMLYQPITPFNTNFAQLNNDIQEMTKYLFQTKNRFTMVAQTTGNGGNEAMVTNLADPGETIIVAVAGVWGAKVADMGRRYKLNVIALSIEPGEVYSFDRLEEEIIKHKPVALFMTHGESSGGVLQPLDGLGDICHRHNCLLAVDVVVSIGVAPFFMDRWKVDAASAASQKGLGAPSGLNPISFSSRAQQKMMKKTSPPPYIFDMIALGKTWDCFDAPMNDSKYHYTYGTNMLQAIRQSLAEICEEGLENVWERHQKCSDRFMSKVGKLGMKHFVEKPEHRFCGVNCVVLPKGIQWPMLHGYLMEKYQIEIGFGIGPTADKEFRNTRIGFLGPNAQLEVVDDFVEILAEGIEYCKSNGIQNGDHKGYAKYIASVK